jgi:hypothetical protein
VGVSLGATYGVPMLMSPPATLWDNGTVRRPLKHGAGKPPRMSGMRLAVAGLGGQVLLSATGLTLGIVSLNAPSVVRLPAEIAACLLLPGIVYFCSLGRLMTLAARVGVSLIAVLACWTAISTAALSLGVRLSGTTTIAMLAVVYVVGLASFVVLTGHRS